MANMVRICLIPKGPSTLFSKVSQGFPLLPVMNAHSCSSMSLPIFGVVGVIDFGLSQRLQAGGVCISRLTLSCGVFFFSQHIFLFGGASVKVFVSSLKQCFALFLSLTSFENSFLSNHQSVMPSLILNFVFSLSWQHLLGNQHF